MSSGSTEPTASCPHATAAIGSRYNPYDPAYDPYQFYALSRREAPICHVPQFGFWLVTGHAELMAILKDPIRFSCAENMTPPVPWPQEVLDILGEWYPFAPGLFNNDPPDHTRVRALCSVAFTPQRVAGMEPAIRALANRLVERFAHEGRGELVSRFSFPFPLLVMAELLGIPHEDIETIRRWNVELLMLMDPNLPRERQLACARGYATYQQYLADIIKQHQAEPKEDLTTALIQARLEGERSFTLKELVSQLIVLINAGHETTTNLIGNMLLLLFQHPEQWRELREDPSLLPAAIEESVRIESPVHVQQRVATEQVELGGVVIPRGARLLMNFAAANRDEKLFPWPDTFDIHRQNPARHVGFGWGTHFCLGAALGRLEVKTAMEVLHARLPNFRPAPGYMPTYEPNFFFRGPKELHLVWDIPGV